MVHFVGSAKQDIKVLTELSNEVLHEFESVLHDRGLQTADDALRECLAHLSEKEADKYQEVHLFISRRSSSGCRADLDGYWQLFNALSPGRGATQALSELMKLIFWVLFGMHPYLL